MDRQQLEWSGSTPLSRRMGVGMCPYCGRLQNQGHDPECAFLTDKPIEEIKAEIDDAAKQAEADASLFDGLVGLRRETRYWREG